MTPYRTRMSHLETTTKWLRDLAEDTAAKAATIRNNNDLTADAKQRAVREVLNASNEEFQRLLADGRQEQVDIDGAIRQALRTQSTDTTALLLVEQRSARGWARAQRLMDAGLSAAEVIEELAEQGDLDALDALEQELPTYLRSALPDAGQRNQIRASLQGLQRRLDDARIPLSQPERRDVLQARREAEDLKATFNATAESTVKVMTSGSGAAITASRDLAQIYADLSSNSA